MLKSKEFVTGVPSTTYNGPLSDNDPAPRIRIEAPEFNFMEDWLLTCTPAILPAKALLMFVWRIIVNCSLLICCAA